MAQNKEQLNALLRFIDIIIKEPGNEWFRDELLELVKTARKNSGISKRSALYDTCFNVLHKILNGEFIPSTESQKEQAEQDETRKAERNAIVEGEPVKLQNELDNSQFHKNQKIDKFEQIEKDGVVTFVGINNKKASGCALATVGMLNQLFGPEFTKTYFTKQDGTLTDFNTVVYIASIDKNNRTIDIPYYHTTHDELPTYNENLSEAEVKDAIDTIYNSSFSAVLSHNAKITPKAPAVVTADTGSHVVDTIETVPNLTGEDVISGFYTRYNIEQTLANLVSNDKYYKEFKNSPVQYYYDNSIHKVVAVIKGEFGAGTTKTINGEEYTIIGVINENENSRFITRLYNRADKENESIINDIQGNPFKSKIKGISEPAIDKRTGKPILDKNTSLFLSIVNGSTLTDKEKETLTNGFNRGINKVVANSKLLRDAIQNLAESFIRKVHEETLNEKTSNGNVGNNLVYGEKHMNDKKELNHPYFRFFTSSFTSMKDRNTGKPLMESFKEAFTKDRNTDYFDNGLSNECPNWILSKVFQTIIFNINGMYRAHMEVADKSKEINKSPKVSEVDSYQRITLNNLKHATEDIDGNLASQLRKFIDGSFILSYSPETNKLSINNDEITITDDMTSVELANTIIYTLLFNKDGSPRMRDTSKNKTQTEETFIKPQINYGKILFGTEDNKTGKQMHFILTNLLKDGAITSPISSLPQDIGRRVVIQSYADAVTPEQAREDADPTKDSESTSNQSNQESEKITDATLDPDSKTKVDHIKEVINESNTEDFKNDPKVYSPVTSLVTNKDKSVEVNEYTEEKNADKSAAPTITDEIKILSTTTGNMVDAICKQVFSDIDNNLDELISIVDDNGIVNRTKQNSWVDKEYANLEHLGVLPENIKPFLGALARTIISLKLSKDNIGGNIHFASGVKVKGSIKRNGTDINVRGEIDLLMYNDVGEVTIVDFKTHYHEADREILDAYSKQVALYAELLRNKGINVVGGKLLDVKIGGYDFDQKRKSVYKQSDDGLHIIDTAHNNRICKPYLESGTSSMGRSGVTITNITDNMPLHPAINLTNVRDESVSSQEENDSFNPPAQPTTESENTESTENNNEESNAESTETQTTPEQQPQANSRRDLIANRRKNSQGSKENSEETDEKTPITQGDLFEQAGQPIEEAGEAEQESNEEEESEEEDGKIEDNEQEEGTEENTSNSTGNNTGRRKLTRRGSVLTRSYIRDIISLKTDNIQKIRAICFLEQELAKSDISLSSVEQKEVDEVKAKLELEGYSWSIPTVGQEFTPRVDDSISYTINKNLAPEEVRVISVSEPKIMKGNYLLQALTVKLETGINPTKITDLTPSEVFDPIERAKEEMEAGTFDENDLGIDIDDIDEIVQEFAKEEEETKKGETKEIKENPVEDAIDNNDEIRDNKEGCKKK